MLSEKGEAVLMHELAHVWQFQNFGWRYIPGSLFAQATSWLKTGSRRGAYDWQKAAQARRAALVAEGGIGGLSRG